MPTAGPLRWAVRTEPWKVASPKVKTLPLDANSRNPGHRAWRRWRLWAWPSGPPPANHEAWRRRRRRQLSWSPPANNPCHRATTRCPLWASPGAVRPLSRRARRRRKQRPPRPTTRASSPCYRAWRRCPLCASPPSTPAAARSPSRRRVPPRRSGPASSRSPALGLVAADATDPLVWEAWATAILGAAMPMDTTSPVARPTMPANRVAARTRLREERSSREDRAWSSK